MIIDHRGMAVVMVIEIVNIVIETGIAKGIVIMIADVTEIDLDKGSFDV